MITFSLFLVITQLVKRVLKHNEVDEAARIAALFIVSYGVLLVVSLVMLQVNEWNGWARGINVDRGSLSIFCVGVVAAVVWVDGRTDSVLKMIRWNLFIKGSELKNWQTEVTTWITGIYLGILFLISLVSGVTNGDAQTYNIARIMSSIINREVFLTSTSIPTQGFHVFGHDYIYTSDIVFNNTTGLSLFGVVEVIVLLIGTYAILRRIQILDRYASIKARVINRFIILGSPPVFFQANNVKNELILSVLAVAIVVLIMELRKKSSVLSGENKKVILDMVCLGCVLLCSAKAYGVLIASVIGAFGILIVCARSYNCTYEKSVRAIERKRVLKRVGIWFLILGTVFYGVRFEMTRYEWWNVEYSDFKRVHGPSVARMIFSFPRNLVRVMVEATINLPIPQRVSFGESSWLGYAGDTLGGRYEFGGVINQDISWPGLVYNIAMFVCIVRILLEVARVKISRLTRVKWVELIGDSYELIILAAVSTVLSMTLLLLIYWQPMYSRYMFTPFVLVIPVVSAIIACDKTKLKVYA